MLGLAIATAALALVLAIWDCWFGSGGSDGGPG